MPCDRLCGCSAPDRAGFDQLGLGVWHGRSAGYTLVKRRLGWDVLSPESESVQADSLLKSFDEANRAATLHARKAGHVHP